MLLRGRWHDRVLAAAGWVAVVCMGAAVACDRFGPAAADRVRWSVVFSAADTVMALLWLAILALALRRGGIVGRGFSMGWLRWFGKYSYGIYVLHYVLAMLLHDPLKEFVREHVSGSKMAGVVVPGVIVFGLSLVAAYGSYHWYEKPFLRLKRYFAYRRVAA
jgi:peptidoglycan/LPS O-acetylase OafA/YrhL